MGKIYQVVVRGLRGEKLYVDLCDTEEQMKSMTVLQLKKKIAEKLQIDNWEHLRMICIDKLLDEDSALLSEYGIQHMSVICMILHMPGGGPGPEKGDGGMGDKEGKNRSMENLFLFQTRVPDRPDS